MTIFSKRGNAQWNKIGGNKDTIRQFSHEINKFNAFLNNARMPINTRVPMCQLDTQERKDSLNINTIL